MIDFAKDIGPQIVTSDLAPGGALDGRAILGRDPATTIVKPVPDVPLLDLFAQGPSKSGLTADEIDGALKGRAAIDDFHALSYKTACNKSTSLFAVTGNKEFCSVLGMAKRTVTKTTFQDRMDEAIRRCDNSQSEVAKRVNLRFGLSITPQTIQYLASRRRKKPAQGSTFTPEIAAVAGLGAEWLASGLGHRDASEAAPVNAHEIKVSLRSTKGMSSTDLRKEAREIGSRWIALSPDERDEHRQAIEMAALRAPKKRKTRR